MTQTKNTVGTKSRRGIRQSILFLFFYFSLSPVFAATPTVGTISPSSGTTTPDIAKTFTSTYSDTDGWANLKDAYFLVSTTTSALSNSSYLYYNQNTNLLYLRNDANTAWLGGFTPGSLNTIENVQVKLNCSSTTVSGSGNTLTVTYNLSFKPAYSGKTYNTYLKAIDDSGGVAGWSKKGTYTINRSPTLGTITPSSGTGQVAVSQTFITTYFDADGWQNIQYVYFLISTSSSALTNTLYAYYNQNTNLLYLRNDTNTAWLGGYALGSSNTIENSYAKLNCQATSVSGSGTTLTLNWSVVLKAPLTGTKNTYLYVRDDVNAYVNLTQKGTWTIPNQSPTVGTITPFSGASAPDETVNFTTTFFDVDTWLNIQYVYFLVSTASSTRTNCLYAYYNQNTNKLYLRNDANTAWLGGYAPGSANVIENSYAKLYCSATTISGSGNTLTVNWSVSFKSAFTGNKNTYLYVRDDANAYQSLVKKGTWGIQTDVTPPTGTLTINNDAQYTNSASVTLSLSAQDEVGGSGLSQMQFSNDATTWFTSGAYATTKDWTLTTPDGTKTVYVKFKDVAGNWSNVVSDTIILDTLPPVIISSWPAKDSYVASQGGPINLNIVFADATSGIDLAKIKLSDAAGNDVTTQAQVLENNIEFLIASPTDKRYSFSLYLEDKAENNTLQAFNFTVDSTVPKISANIIGGEFSEPLTVKLQCSESTTIYYSTDGYPPIEGASNTIAVKGSFADIFINKTTNLQFFAMDNAGNRSATKTETYFFNELPAAVSGVQAFYNESQKRVELQWPYAASVSGYYIYRALNIQEINLLKDSNTRKYAAPSRLRISLSLVTDNLFYDNAVLSGATYWYGVSIVDVQGVESPVSELVSIKIPDQPQVIDRKEAARRALAWIEVNQKPQGYWGEKKEIRMLATSQILNALFWAYWPNGRQPNIWIWRALFWLRGNFADNNDYLARKILTLSNYNQNITQEYSRLVSQAHFEGQDVIGWGMQKRYSDDAVSTILGARALRCGFVSGWRIVTLGYPILLTVPRSPQGRYGWVPGKDSSVFVSALVYSIIPNAKDYGMYDWILNAQNADGSFGKGVIDTAAVLLWLPLDETAKLKAMNYIISQQSSNGSWNNNDAYITGLCLDTIFPRYWSGDWNAPW